VKILFVDDEPAILRTLQRTLRNLLATHQIDFESNPLAAMARLGETDYDLVVTDMRMPGCNGVQVLEAAARCNPGGVRAVLSGYSGEDEMAQVIPLAHLFIGKPFDPSTITDLIARASALVDMPLPDDLRRRLGGLQGLPPVPKLFATLNRALEEHDRKSSLADICAILNQDVALAAKLMQLANSAFFGGGVPVVRIEQAVQLLGTRLLSGLVLQHELFSNMALSPGLLAWREALNQESLATAELAVRIARARHLDAVARDEAAMAALLHDIGHLIMLSEFQDADQLLTLPQRQHGDALCRHEEALIGAHHGWIGAYLLRLWGLPQSLVEAVAWHHHPSASGIPGFTTLTLVHVADALLRERDGVVGVLDEDYLDTLGGLEHLSTWREIRDQ
jgi:putative nucleotidyltransferase with HDIG domain